MTRLVDRMLRRATGFWEGMASGAATLTTTYGRPDQEAVLPTLARATHEAYGSNSPVFAAILVRLKLFSEARFTWQALDDKHLFGDTSLSVLEHPFGPGTNSGELLVRMQQDASLAGNAYIWAPPGEGRLVRKRPDWVTIISRLVPAGDGGVYREKIGYWWEPPKDARDQGEGHFMPAGQVCHWAPIPDPLADFRGMSWLSPALRDIQGDNGMSAYKIKYLQHAATPNLLLKYAQKLQPGTVDSIRERVTARYGGVDNAFRTLVLDQGADATVIGANMQQLDFTGVSLAGVERILADSMVPGVLIGLEPLRGAGRGYQESMQKLANLWARPEWRDVCGALEHIVPPPANQDGIAGVRLWFDDDDIAALQDGEMEKGQTALVRAQAVLTSRQAGATFDSAVSFVDSGDVTKLQFDPGLTAPGAQPVQNMLGQPGQPGATAEPIPPGHPRLDVGPVSPHGGDSTSPLPRMPSSARRALEQANGHG